MQQAISVCSPNFDPMDSYGRIASELLASLHEAGYHVNTIGFDEIVPEKRMIPTMGGLLLGYPTNFKNFGPMVNMGPRIAITMFESTALPKGWAEELNKCAAVIVPCRWCKEVFEANGVTAPVHVVPLGISEAFQYKKRQIRRYRPYTFLTIADRGKRKGWMTVLNAFLHAFGDDPNYQLILKCRKGSLPFKLTNGNIQIVDRDMSMRRLARLYAEADCMVFASSGEGFALPPREFAATGGTVLATNWSGMADDIGQWGVPLDYGFQDAWLDQPEHPGLGKWAKIDPEYLATMMKHETLEEVRRARQMTSKLVSQRTIELYSWRRFAQQIVTTWRQIQTPLAKGA